MARIGLDNFRYSVLTEAADGTPSYNGAQTLAKAITLQVDITNNDVSLYADNVLAESDTSFQKGEVTIEVDDDNIQVLAVLLGHTVDENGKMVRNVNDVAPYVGFGQVIDKLVENTHQYKVEFLYKVKFAEPSLNVNTRKETVEFQTTQFKGTVAALKSGKWSETQVFDTKEAAITYLEGLMAKGS